MRLLTAIPVHKEEKYLEGVLREVLRYADHVLVVDDGSTDRTAAVAESFRGKIPALRVVPNGLNRGKGFSVRHGVEQSHGRIVLFTDADLSAPIEEASKLIDALEHFDLAIGSRAVNRSLITVHQLSLIHI